MALNIKKPKKFKETEWSLITDEYSGNSFNHAGIYLHPGISIISRDEGAWSTILDFHLDLRTLMGYVNTTGSLDLPSISTEEELKRFKESIGYVDGETEQL